MNCFKTQGHFNKYFSNKVKYEFEAGGIDVLTKIKTRLTENYNLKVKTFEGEDRVKIKVKGVNRKENDIYLSGEITYFSGKVSLCGEWSHKKIEILLLFFGIICLFYGLCSADFYLNGKVNCSDLICSELFSVFGIIMTALIIKSRICVKELILREVIKAMGADKKNREVM